MVRFPLLDDFGLFWFCSEHWRTYKNMKPEDYEFLDALILGQSSPEEAYRRFDELSAKHVEMLRKGTKNIQDARSSFFRTIVLHILIYIYLNMHMCFWKCRKMFLFIFFFNVCSMGGFCPGLLYRSFFLIGLHMPAEQKK